MLAGGQMKLSYIDGDEERDDSEDDPGQMKMSFVVEEDEADAELQKMTDVFDDDLEDEEPKSAPVVEPVKLDDKAAARRLEFAGIPAYLVDDPWTVFPARIVKEASDSSDYFARDDAHPLTLLAIMTSSFGDEWRDWESETIQEMIVSDVGVEPSSVTMSKIMALKVVLKMPAVVYDDWHVLEKVVVAFSGQLPAMTEIEDLTPDVLCHGIAIINNLAKGKFGLQATLYIAARLYDAGYVLAPVSMAFADPQLKKLVENDQLRSKVLAGYQKALKGKLPSVTSVNPVDIQVSRLMACHEFTLTNLDDVVGQLS